MYICIYTHTHTHLIVSQQQRGLDLLQKLHAYGARKLVENHLIGVCMYTYGYMYVCVYVCICVRCTKAC